MPGTPSVPPPPRLPPEASHFIVGSPDALHFAHSEHFRVPKQPPGCGHSVRTARTQRSVIVPPFPPAPPVPPCPASPPRPPPLGGSVFFTCEEGGWSFRSRRNREASSQLARAPPSPPFCPS